MRHDLHDRVSLEIARRIASELIRRPEWIALARENLDRWSLLNHNSPGLLRCYDEWRSLLDLPVPQLAALLTADTDRDRRLRQNSPFAGALVPAEVWDIKRRLRHEQTAA